MYVIFSNGASYSSDFSTIVRTARGARLSHEIKLNDMDGRDPLPRYLAISTIAVSRVRCKTQTLSGGDTGELGLATELRDVSGQSSSDGFRRDQEADSGIREVEGRSGSHVGDRSILSNPSTHYPLAPSIHDSQFTVDEILEQAQSATELQDARQDHALLETNDERSMSTGRS